MPSPLDRAIEELREDPTNEKKRKRVLMLQQMVNAQNRKRDTEDFQRRTHGASATKFSYERHDHISETDGRRLQHSHANGGGYHDHEGYKPRENPHT